MRSVAYSGLKQKRASTPVEVGSGGYLGDYVPFYFGTLSPMLLTYKDGNVTGRPESQEELIYLVSSAEVVARSGLSYAFTDGHPIKEPRAFYSSLDRLDQVDFSIMQGRWWFDSEQHPDRKRKRQAEFLVHQALPWSLVTALGVQTPGAKAWVESVVAQSTHRPAVLLKPEWYYPS